MPDHPATAGLALLGALGLIVAASCGDFGDVVELRYDSGALRARGRVVEDESGTRRLDGRWSFWYPTGQLQSVGGFEGTRVLGDGALRDAATVVPRGGREGLWITHSEGGEVASRGAYRDGLRHGPWRWHFDDGSPKAAASFVDGALDGVSTRWHPSGELAEQGAFELGVRVGSHRTWHENGQVATEGRYDAGLETGLHRTFSEFGVLLEETAYHEGERNGVSSAWDEEGELLWSVEFRDGEPSGPPLFERTGFQGTGFQRTGADGEPVGVERTWRRTAEVVAARSGS